jgi:glutamate---cysteine ligase / carboxylate-amine ligase
VLDHSFNGTPFTVGVEEELMLIDADSLDLAQEIEAVLADVPPELEGQVKPELMQSVLEVATTPCADLGEAAEQLTELRRAVGAICERRGLLVGAAGTHPFARFQDQKIVERERYTELVEELGYIARQELIFGTHVHVGIDNPEKAIYVADGIRRYLPLMLAASSNSPFWQGEVTGLMSSRTPVFRAFPRVGIPPHYGSWEIYSARVETMMKAGAIEDYTYMWWDVRPHPKLGTVETRVFDQQTRLEHTLSLAALTISLAHRFARLWREGEPMTEAPTELIDDNKVRAAVRGLEGVLVDFAQGTRAPATEMARRVLDEVREDAEELGIAHELGGIGDLCRDGTGARRQLEMLEHGRDMRDVVREIAEKTRP